MKKLESLVFDNRYATLGDAYFSRVEPTPAPAPYRVAFNPDAARLLDLDPSEAARPEFVEYFSGARLLPGSDPLAMVYSGHQFGVRVPRLGDGRAILLGQVRNARGESWDLHLKGSGQTPYSRQGDGRAVLRSSIREYLCGEAMHGLGIPTTRTLCIVGSDEPVYRERPETRALIVRLAPSHVRFGSFEYFFFRHHHEPETQKQRLAALADHVIGEFFPALVAAYPAAADRYAAWFKEVAERTGRLMAQWQAAGFAHGVMNTDNMSILGLTLDYGPYGFVEDFDLDFIPNHSDETGRYAFSQQPSIGLWNLNVLAQSVLPLMDVPHAVAALSAYEPAFHRELLRLLRSKLGLTLEREEDGALLDGLFEVLRAARVDYTNFFRALGSFSREAESLTAMFAEGSPRQAWLEWLPRYRARLDAEDAAGDTEELRRQRMNRANPKFVLRNYLAQRAIDDASQRREYGEIERLLTLLRAPFDEHPGLESYAERAPEWGRHLVVSCSS